RRSARSPRRSSGSSSGPASRRPRRSRRGPDHGRPGAGEPRRRTTRRARHEERCPVAEARIWTFFYGSYMNQDVLREVDLVPERFEVARLAGFDIRIEPRANLVPSDRATVYGVLAEAAHAELERLYTHARTVLGETYHPHPVLAERIDGGYR